LVRELLSRLFVVADDLDQLCKLGPLLAKRRHLFGIDDDSGVLEHLLKVRVLALNLVELVEHGRGSVPAGRERSKEFGAGRFAAS
jgi:hypothetical protein